MNIEPSSCLTGPAKPDAIAATIAVIIPYYQRTPGILARGLDSVFRQSSRRPLQVIVVDDGSPSPVDSELTLLDPAHRPYVTVIRQQNQGPGPARNAGLLAVPETAEYVAFLDSDDLWHEDHLSRALTLLDQGFEFFFADGNLAGGSLSLFRTMKLDLSEHACVDDRYTMFEFRGDFVATLLQRTPVVTSSVVMRKDRLGHVRFPSSRGTCEDLLYWLEIALKAPRIGFSSEIEVTGGKDGVHVSHRGEWKSNKSLGIIDDFAEYYRHVLRAIPMSPGQRQEIQRLSAANRLDFVITVLAMLKSGSRPYSRLVGRFVRRNPRLILDLVGRFRTSFVRLVVRR